MKKAREAPAAVGGKDLYMTPTLAVQGYF